MRVSVAKAVLPTPLPGSQLAPAGAWGAWESRGQAACQMETRPPPTPVQLTWCLLSAMAREPAPHGGPPTLAVPTTPYPQKLGHFLPKNSSKSLLPKDSSWCLGNLGLGAEKLREAWSLRYSGVHLPPGRRMRTAAPWPWGVAGHCPKKSRHLARLPWPRAGPLSKTVLEAAASRGPRVSRGTSPPSRPSSALWLGQRYLAPRAGRWVPAWAHAQADFVR